jgi:undecaprenyl-diphosphatase
MVRELQNHPAEKSPEAKKVSYRKHVWLAAVSATLFVLLALYVRAGITVGFEGWIYTKAVAHMSPAITAVVKGVTHLGDTTTVAVFCLLLVVIPRSRKTIALPVSSAVVLSALLNILLKELFARERPDILRLINETSYSFPSGHAMINASLYTMLIIMCFKFIKSRSRRLAVSVPCGLVAAAIGFSRVYLGVHYAGDILGGWIIGFAVAILVYAFWKVRVFNKGLARR